VNLKNNRFFLVSIFPVLRNLIIQRRLFVLLITCSTITLASPPDDYPVPPETDSRLFYLQRSTNANTVVYDASLLPNGNLNPKRPVEAYWLRYASHGERKALNFIQRKFAYGLNFEKIKENTYKIFLKAYSGREIKVSIDSQGRPIAVIRINKQLAKLKRVYIDVSGSGLWTTVNYIDLLGNSLKDGKLLRERFNPND
jgi:hypothetical protein